MRIESVSAPQRLQRLVSTPAERASKGPVAPCRVGALRSFRQIQGTGLRCRAWVGPVALWAAIALLSACATDGLARDAERLALYEAHAGPPVQSAAYFGSLNGWTPLGEDAIALWTRPSQAYLVRFVGSCPGIDFANAIRVTNQGGRVHARFDSVVPLGGSRLESMPCRIGELRALDIKAIRAGERGAREARAAERPDGA